MVYDKENIELPTTSFQSGDWEPNSPADWRKDTIDLTPFTGSNVFISFVNTTAASNNTYLDNILIYESSPVWNRRTTGII